MSDVIEIYKGDSKTIQATVTAGGVAFDLTGYSAKLTIRRAKTTSLILQLTGTISTPANGIILFDISKTQSDILPATYVYDIQITNGTKVYTIKDSNFIVIQDITY